MLFKLQPMRLTTHSKLRAFIHCPIKYSICDGTGHHMSRR
jgi:hypothetical protein